MKNLEREVMSNLKMVDLFLFYFSSIIFLFFLILDLVKENNVILYITMYNNCYKLVTHVTGTTSCDT